MKKYPEFTLTLQKGDKGSTKIPIAKRRSVSVRQAKPTISAKTIGSALKSTPGAKAVLAGVPEFGKVSLWGTVATFSVCQKTGTATYLDLWNADHFDGVTDMQNNLSDCKVWFSANGYSTWGSPETTSGVVNCYFRAPSAGNYVCNVQLESHSGSAVVECFIDSSSFGPLPFNGSKNQPHPCNLTAGYHAFKIEQMSGAFFFVGLTVWQVPVLAPR